MTQEKIKSHIKNISAMFSVLLIEKYTFWIIGQFKRLSTHLLSAKSSTCKIVSMKSFLLCWTYAQDCGITHSTFKSTSSSASEVQREMNAIDAAVFSKTIKTAMSPISPKWLPEWKNQRVLRTSCLKPMITIVVFTLFDGSEYDEKWGFFWRTNSNGIKERQKRNQCRSGTIFGSYCSSAGNLISKVTRHLPTVLSWDESQLERIHSQRRNCTLDA